MLGFHVVYVERQYYVSQPSEREAEPWSQRPYISRKDLGRVTNQASIEDGYEEFNGQNEGNCLVQFRAFGLLRHAVGRNLHKPKENAADGDYENTLPHDVQLELVEYENGHDGWIDNLLRIPNVPNT